MRDWSFFVKLLPPGGRPAAGVFGVAPPPCALAKLVTSELSLPFFAHFIASIAEGVCRLRLSPRKLTSEYLG